MKKVNFKLRVEKFTNWLKNSYTKDNGERFKSWVNYGYYIEQAVLDLCVNPDQFASINKAGIVKSILNALDRSGKFQSRPVKIQSDIKSGFKAYIKFLEANPSL